MRSKSWMLISVVEHIQPGARAVISLGLGQALAYPERMAYTRLWQCPGCGHGFVTRNMSHSCGRHAISDLLAGAASAVRELFDCLRAVVAGFGPVKVYAEKTRIVFQVPWTRNSRVCFARRTPWDARSTTVRSGSQPPRRRNRRTQMRTAQ